MRKIFTVLFLILPFVLFAQYKSEYDINEKSLSKSIAGSTIKSAQSISNNMLEATMLDGGYFTLGTKNGISASKLDDNCQITFGHPYAKTSYPVIFIDAVPYKFEDLFAPEETQGPVINGDTIKFSGTNSTIEASFKIILDENDGKADFLLLCENLDNTNHIYNAGIVFDPALGKWGDGYLKVDGTFIINSPGQVQESRIKNAELWERNTGAAGIGLKFNVPADNNYEMFALNWELSRVFNPFALVYYEAQKIYDLVLMCVANSTTLSSGQKLEHTFSLDLIEPDFSSALFTRWDTPQFFTIDEGVVFPNDFNAIAEIYNTTSNILTVNSINSEAPKFLSVTPVTQNLIIEPNSYSYAAVKIDSRIIYEPVIADIALWFNNNSEKLDLINRSVFMPQTPVSTEGLKIINDSLDYSTHPDVNLIFSVENENTGVLVRNLSEENIFLYENGIRIDDFEINKHTGGLSNLVDVVFVLDVSGSMGDEIAAVKNNLNDFGISLSENNLDFKIGVVTFSTTVDHIWDFTSDLEQVKNNLASIRLWGGVEDSPSALFRASELSFRQGSRRTIIWITDEPYPEDQYTKQQVVDRMLEKGITVNGLGLLSLQTDWFNPILIPTGGNFYDINGNFKDILIDISNQGSQDLYKLSYKSRNTTEDYNVKLEIRYAGLGGQSNYSYSKSNPLAQSEKRLSFFPNPFNPTITFNVNIKEYQSGTLNIYNILGQLVKEYNLTSTSNNTVAWNAVNNFGQLVSTGFYLVQLSLLDNNNNRYTETAKILYLK
ncbi:MAG: hypothetical protein CVV23_10720 [Ignavibacteriae bacterium HGW-Ignavibacteriae-2]|jgi:hypothetical protein|nr:MAG: hypothetical protein CVV23_10720 [Ignavibacteriae bacterium HGW-Ignavibacteriae-2]